MDNKFFKQVIFNKGNKSVRIVSVDLNEMIDEMRKGKGDEGEIKFTFDVGGEIDFRLDEDIETGQRCLTISLISVRKFKNKNNNKNYINSKKENKKIERKKYQERKNKETEKKVSNYSPPTTTHKKLHSTNGKPEIKNGNPNPKQLRTDLSNDKSKFYYEGDEFVQSKEATKVAVKISKLKDWECVSVDKWSSSQFLQYMGHKFNQVYGFSSLEFSVVDGKRYQSSAKGILYVKIKSKLISVFAEINLGKADLKNYIDWMYDIKSSELDFPITLNFLCSKAMITEWLQKKIKKGKNNINKNIGVNKKIHKPKM